MFFCRVGRVFFFCIITRLIFVLLVHGNLKKITNKQTKQTHEHDTKIRLKSDDELFWNPNHNGQQKEERFHEESIPSMHFNPINANSQRAVFEHMNHGPVPVRGASQQHRSGAQSPSMESRHFIQQSATSFRPFQGGQRPHSDSQFNVEPSSAGQFQPQVRVQGDGSAELRHQPSSSHGVVPLLFRQQQTQPPPQQQQQSFSERPVPFTAFSKQPNTRLPNNNRSPVLTAPQFQNSPTATDDFDGSNDEQQSPTLDWNQQPQRQAQQTFRPGPPRYKDMLLYYYRPPPLLSDFWLSVFSCDLLADTIRFSGILLTLLHVFF